MVHEKSEGLMLAISAVGGLANTLAERLDISPQAISQWRDIPLNRVIAVETITGIHRGKLRPDLYPPENPAIVREAAE